MQLHLISGQNRAQNDEEPPVESASSTTTNELERFCVLSPKQLKAFTDVFQHVDEDSDGLLLPVEACTAMHPCCCRTLT